MRLLIVLALIAGCYRRDLADCAVACATATDCPSGLACTASGRCATSATATCDDIDGGADGPSATSIHVLALDDHGLPAIGLRVIAAAADGSAIDEATTIGDGTAELSSTATADVTVLRVNGTGVRATTIRAVAPGASLTFGARRNEAPSVSRMFTWNTDPNAFKYQVRTSCGEPFAIVDAQGGVTTQSTTLTLDPTCASDFDAMVFYITQFTNQPAFQLVTGNSGDVTASGSYTAFAGDLSTFAQLPADVALGDLHCAGRTVFRAADPAFGQGAFGIVTGGSSGANAILQLPIAGAAAREMYTTLGRSSDPFAQVQQIVERVPAQGQYNLNVEPAMVPWMLAAPVTDLGARKITWTEATAGALARTDGDLVAAELTYNRGATAFRWRIIAPPSAVMPTGNAGELQLAIPDLPGDELIEPFATDTLGQTQVRSYGLTAAAPVDYATLASRADLAISFTIDNFNGTDTFLTSGLFDTELTRMVVSTHTP